MAAYSISSLALFAGLRPGNASKEERAFVVESKSIFCCCSWFCSSDMVFLRPREVVPGILGPTMDEVYLMISVSGGKRTPSNEGWSL